MLKAIEPDLRVWANSENFFLAQTLFLKACELLSPLTASEAEVVRKNTSQLIQKWKKAGLVEKAKATEGYPSRKVI